MEMIIDLESSEIKKEIQTYIAYQLHDLKPPWVEHKQVIAMWAFDMAKHFLERGIQLERTRIFRPAIGDLPMPELDSHTCDNCSHFTDFKVCDKFGYNTTGCNKNVDWSFKQKNNASKSKYSR